MPTESPSVAFAAFRTFFDELRSVYLEREALFAQIELALLCREHVLVVGPPGTAKSAVANAVLARIVDEKTGLPSLFSRQLSESTVQTDLIGSVDFKVLTETGRTEYLTEDGMLGATHAFLDEVFDGRDMLLRSILNVLHERELKHGRRVTAGRTECAIMTSNRYLSEVLTRSPEVLLAFADRLSFISFVPRSFARESSRGVMLARFAPGQRPVLKASLTLQQLDRLQSLVEQVEVPSVILEALESLADELERALHAQVARLPDFVPTKYFSHRSTVKAVWALKAGVVRDCLYRRADRPLVAAVEDLGMLRHFFLLGGPPLADVDKLVRNAVDPCERAQLEIIRVEHQAFDEVLAQRVPALGGGVDREAKGLDFPGELLRVEALGRQYGPMVALEASTGLSGKLVPGPRHPQNRVPLVSALKLLVSAVELRVARGPAASGEPDGDSRLAASFGEVLHLCRVVPELADHQLPLCRLLSGYCREALERVALQAEAAEYELPASSATFAELSGSLSGLEAQLKPLSLLGAQLGRAGETGRPGQREWDAAVRQRTAEAARRRVVSAFLQNPSRELQSEPASLHAEASQLAILEERLAALSPGIPPLREELLGPLGAQWAARRIREAPFERLDELGLVIVGLRELLEREGMASGPILAGLRPLLRERVQAFLRTGRAAGVAPPPLSEADALSGDGYLRYRGALASTGREGESSALRALESHFDGGAVGEELLSLVSAGACRDGERVRFLREWFSLVSGALPEAPGIATRAEADRTVDLLIQSRFPLLALREGEFARLEQLLRGFDAPSGPRAASALPLLEQVTTLAREFSGFSQQLLQKRAAL